MYTKETMTAFAKLIDEKKINLVRIGDMTKQELIETGEQLSLTNLRTKPLELLRREIAHLSKLFLAGQVCYKLPPPKKIKNKNKNI